MSGMGRSASRFAVAAAWVLAAVLAPIPEGAALESPPLEVMDILEPAFFFRAAPAVEGLRWDEGEMALIQGQPVLLPVPVDMRLGLELRAGRERVTLECGATLLVECVFHRRHPLPQDGAGEPFNTLKRVGQNEILKNIIIRGAARDSGDGAGLLAHVPEIRLVQNTGRSFVLTARADAERDGEEGAGLATETVYEGAVLLGDAAMAFSAIGYGEAAGPGGGGLFLDWLNRLLDG